MTIDSRGLPSLKVRKFSGKREDYEEWRRELETLMQLYGVKPEKMAPLMYLALEPGFDKPRDLL